MHGHHTDGNAVAGLLAEILAVEPTTVERRCHACGDARVLGEHRAYHGAGLVLRCPSCEAVALILAGAGERVSVTFLGAFRFGAGRP